MKEKAREGPSKARKGSSYCRSGLAGDREAYGVTLGVTLADHARGSPWREDDMKRIILSDPLPQELSGYMIENKGKRVPSTTQ